MGRRSKPEIPELKATSPEVAFFGPQIQPLSVLWAHETVDFRFVLAAQLGAVPNHFFASWTFTPPQPQKAA
jgi:hypothetical protein